MLAVWIVIAALMLQLCHVGPSDDVLNMHVSRLPTRRQYVMREVVAAEGGRTAVAPLSGRPAWLQPLLQDVAAGNSLNPAGDSDPHHAECSHSHEHNHERDGCAHRDESSSSAAAACSECGAAECSQHAPAAGHLEGSGVSSVSLRLAGPVDLQALRLWLDELLWDRAAGRPDVLRLKAVLHVAGSGRMHMLQAVYETYDVMEGPEWHEGTVRESRFVVIGRHLQRAELQHRLEACAA